MLASTRERRANAGSKIAALLNKEDCDDFYKSTYGGFFDDDQDNEFESPVESESDEVDSDFDVEEDDEVISDEGDQEGGSLKRSRLVVTKSYKEPSFSTKTKKSKLAKDSAGLYTTGSTDAVLRTKRPRHPSDESSTTPRSDALEKKLRRSTIQKSEAAAEHRQQMDLERNEWRAKYKNKKVSKEPEVILTQEELLEEAKQTEIENLKSLERFQQFELEKKKISRLSKQRHIKGPIVRFFSTSMPCGGEKGRCSRTFVSFSDDKTFDEIFCAKNRSSAAKNTTNVNFSVESAKLEAAVSVESIGHHPSTHRRVCAVTGLPAKYTDPASGLSYANIEAFKLLRSAYCKFVEEKAHKEDKGVAKWLAYWRARKF